MKNNKKIQVALFQWCISDYRLGIFRKLQSRGDMTFTICAPDNVEGHFLCTSHKEKGFPFINTVCPTIKLPLINKIIMFQPYMVACIFSRKFDVIILPNDFSNLGVWLALLLGPLFGCKVCLWGHGTTKRCVKISRFFRGLIMHLAKTIIFYTEGVRDKWLKQGFRREKLFVAYNALDTDISNAIIAKTTKEDLDNFCCKNGFRGKDIVIFSGRLIMPWKRPDILIRAMKEVLAKKPNAHLVVIGDGPDRKELEGLACELELTGHITFTGAIHDEELIGKFMLVSKLAVIPGNAGLGIQHAFGYGVPFITNSNLDAQTPEIELLNDGVTGKLCREGDVGDFANTIVHLLTDETERQMMSKNAFNIIETKYNVNNMAKGFFDAVAYCVKNKTLM